MNEGPGTWLRRRFIPVDNPRTIPPLPQKRKVNLNPREQVLLSRMSYLSGTTEEDPI